MTQRKRADLQRRQPKYGSTIMSAFIAGSGLLTVVIGGIQQDMTSVGIGLGLIGFSKHFDVTRAMRNDCRRIANAIEHLTYGENLADEAADD